MVYLVPSSVIRVLKLDITQYEAIITPYTMALLVRYIKLVTFNLLVYERPQHSSSVLPPRADGALFKYKILIVYLSNSTSM